MIFIFKGSWLEVVRSMRCFSYVTLEVVNGAKKKTRVYVVHGYKPEPLLGDHDAEDLGIITFNPEVSRDPTPRSPTSRSSDQHDQATSINQYMGSQRGTKDPTGSGH